MGSHYLVTLLKKVFIQARHLQTHEIVLDGKGLCNLFKLNETDALRFLTAFYKDLDSQGIRGPLSHLALASNITTAPSPISLHIPVFIQERGPEAYKFGEYTE